MKTEPGNLFRRRPSIRSLAGLAAHLRADEPVTLADVLAATVASALFGQFIAVVWCLWYGGAEHLVFMTVVSFLAGAGAMNVVDLVCGCSGCERS